MSGSSCSFTYAHYREIFQTALDEGYEIVTLADWFRGEYAKQDKVLINRIDVDDNINRLWVMGGIFRELGIRASIFFRLHASGYNLMFFDNLNLVRSLAEQGCEIGLHSEIEDVRHICGLDPEKVLRAELEMFRNILGVEQFGVASHGDLTPYNNLDFWKARSPQEFGFVYEAYDENLWNNCRYVSDSEYTRWKAYENGKLREGDRRCACEHIREGASPIYLLTHSCSYYERHIRENTIPLG